MKRLRSRGLGASRAGRRPSTTPTKSRLISNLKKLRFRPAAVKKLLSIHSAKDLAAKTAGVVFIGGIVSLVLILVSKKPIADDRLCIVGQPVAVHHVLIVDKTDRFTPHHSDQLTRFVTAIRDSVRRFERLSIFTIDEESIASPEAMFPPVFDLCNPGNSAIGDKISQIYENPEEVAKLYREQFAASLERVMTDLDRLEEASHSPVFKTLTQVNGWREFDLSVRKKVYMFSDLMEHNIGGYSHYQTPVGEFGVGMPDDMRNISKDMMDGVEVTLAYLRRPELIGRQGSKHLAFWRAYLTKTGATTYLWSP